MFAAVTTPSATAAPCVPHNEPENNKDAGGKCDGYWAKEVQRPKVVFPLNAGIYELGVHRAHHA